MKKRKLKVKNLILLICLFVFWILFLFSGTKIIHYIKDNRENKKIQKIVEEAITIHEDKKVTEEERYEVDFTKLKEQNPDTVAYLKVNGTNIQYVVVKGEDNDYYLKHNFYKKLNHSGWIFTDYHNQLDGKDQNIVIYGHAIQDGSMFGTLKNALEKDWQQKKENQMIVLVTEKEVSFYQVFSTYMIDPEMYYINTIFKDDNEFQQFINEIYYRSNYQYGVTVSKEDTILTLSTCNLTGSKRVVLHAKKIENVEESKKWVKK